MADDVRRAERLDAAIEALLQGRADAAASALIGDAESSALLAVAAELVDLPREDFRASLGAALADAAEGRPAARGRGTTVQTCLVVRDPAAAIAFYRDAFGAVEVGRFTDRAGNVQH